MRRRHKPTDKILASLASLASPEARREAIYLINHSLQRIGNPRHHPRQIDQAFEAIHGLLRSDPAEEVRYEAAHTFTFWFQDRAAWALLPVLLDKSETPRVRGQAAEGLGCGLELHKITPERRERIRAALEAGLQDPELEVRFWSVYAAGLLLITELRPLLEAIRDSDRRLLPGLWYLNDEAADALEYFDTGTWPDRDFVREEAG